MEYQVCLSSESLNQSASQFLKINNKAEKIGEKRSGTFFFSFTSVLVSANGFNDSFQNWTRNRCQLIRDLNLMTWLYRYGTQNICVLVPNINVISLQESFTFFLIFNKLVFTNNITSQLWSCCHLNRPLWGWLSSFHLVTSILYREPSRRITSYNKLILNYVDITFLCHVGRFGISGVHNCKWQSRIWAFPDSTSLLFCSIILVKQR